MLAWEVFIGSLEMSMEMTPEGSPGGSAKRTKRVHAESKVIVKPAVDEAPAKKPRAVS